MCFHSSLCLYNVVGDVDVGLARKCCRLVTVLAITV